MLALNYATENNLLNMITFHLATHQFQLEFLGSLRFIIYINDLPQARDEINFIMYAGVEHHM